VVVEADAGQAAERVPGLDLANRIDQKGHELHATPIERSCYVDAWI
jgi:hypothetical protein